MAIEKIGDIVKFRSVKIYNVIVTRPINQMTLAPWYQSHNLAT